MQDLTMENIKSVEDIFNKRGKLNEEEVKEAIKFLEEEEKNEGKRLAAFYSDLFKKAKTKIESMLKEGTLDISNEGINELLNRFDGLDKVERELGIDIANAMLEHYKDPTKYKYELKNMFLIYLDRALEDWSKRREIEELGMINLEEIESMLKMGVDEDTYVNTLYVNALIGMLLTAGSYYDSVEYENKRMKLETNPDEFIDEEIDEEIYKLPLDESIKNSDLGDRISKRVYEKLKEKKYISEELPPFDHIKEILPNFSQIFIESILELKDTTFKLSVVGVASYYNAIKNIVDTFGLKNEAERIKNEINRLMNENKITINDTGISKNLLDLVVKLKQNTIKSAKRENVDYII